jgi:hypothetical protein
MKLLDRCWAVLLVLVLACATLVQAAGGGSGGDDPNDSNVDVYLALGAAAIIGAILVFDMLSGPEPQASDTVEITAPLIEDTGVDWTDVTSETQVPTVVVSVFPPSGTGIGTGPLFLEYLRLASGASFDVYPDPLDLGHGSPSEESALAEEFFGAGYFVAGASSDSGLVLSLFRGTEGPVWTRTVSPADTSSLHGAAADLAEHLRNAAGN